MDFDFLQGPLQSADAWLEGLLHGAPLLTALAVAVLLGLRHASDPDHLVAVTSLVAAEGGGVRRGMRLGAWWGAGHAAALVAIGLPLIVLGIRVPPALEQGAEVAIGLVIVAIGLRVLAKWLRGGYRAAVHPHADRARHRHVHQAAAHAHAGRTPWQAAAIGVLHGLGGTGAVVLLLIAALPTRAEAAVVLLVFAPMSMASMAACTGAFAWLLTRPALSLVARVAVIPALGAFSVAFGAWYAGLG